MRRPRVKLDILITFLTIAAKRNIDEAAQEIGLSASGVRKQLDLLENALGTRLLEKVEGRLALTEDGELFYQDATKTIEQALLAEEQVRARQEIRNGHLIVGHSTNLPPKVIFAIVQLRIKDAHPVHIEHRSGLTTTTVRRVIDGSLHAGFGILPICAPELIVRMIYEEPLLVCVPIGHRFVAKPAISPQELSGEPFIAVSREPWPRRHQEIEEHFGDFGVTLPVVADAYSAREAVAYVEQKIGICLLPRSAIAGWPGVVAKPLSTRVLMRRCGVFIREDNRSPLMQKLIEASLQQSGEARLSRGQVPIRLTLAAREDPGKVKGIS